MLEIFQKKLFKKYEKKSTTEESYKEIKDDLDKVIGC